eukprot:7708116-Alexandrium_andersonii.AAC.1
MEHAPLVSNACAFVRVCVLPKHEQENLLCAFSAVACQRSPGKVRMASKQLPSLAHDSGVVLRGAKRCTKRE